MYTCTCGVQYSQFTRYVTMAMPKVGMVTQVYYVISHISICNKNKSRQKNRTS